MTSSIDRQFSIDNDKQNEISNAQIEDAVRLIELRRQQYEMSSNTGIEVPTDPEDPIYRAYFINIFYIQNRFVSALLDKVKITLASGEFNLMKLVNLIDPADYPEVHISRQEEFNIATNILKAFLTGARKAQVADNLENIREVITNILLENLPADGGIYEVDKAIDSIIKAIDKDYEDEQPPILEYLNSNYHNLMFMFDFAYMFKVLEDLEDFIGYTIEIYPAMMKDVSSVTKYRALFIACAAVTIAAGGKLKEGLSLKNSKIYARNPQLIDELIEHLAQIEQEPETYREQYSQSHMYIELVDNEAELRAKRLELYVNRPETNTFLNQAMRFCTKPTGDPARICAEYRLNYTFLAKLHNILHSFRLDMLPPVPTESTDEQIITYLSEIRKGLESKIQKVRIMLRDFERYKTPEILTGMGRELAGYLINNFQESWTEYEISSINYSRGLVLNDLLTTQIEIDTQFGTDYPVLSILCDGEPSIQSGFEILYRWRNFGFVFDISFENIRSLMDTIKIEIAEIIFREGKIPEYLSVLRYPKLHEELEQFNEYLHALDLLEESEQIDKSHKNRELITNLSKLHAKYFGKPLSSTKLERVISTSRKSITAKIDSLQEEIENQVFTLEDIVFLVEFNLWRAQYPEQKNYPMLLQVENYESFVRDLMQEV